MAKQSYNTHHTHQEDMGYEENVAKLRELLSENRRREGREYYKNLSEEDKKRLRETKEGSGLVKSLSVSC